MDKERKWKEILRSDVLGCKVIENLVLRREDWTATTPMNGIRHI